MRPTAEPVRAALLDELAKDVKGARVLDLFAGTGALGLEAVSRGAKSADFVEFRPDSLHALRANVAALGLQKTTRIFKKDAVPFVAALSEHAYDLAFADPPYESKVIDRIMDAWKTVKFARVLVVEHAAATELPRGDRVLTFADTRITIYRG